MSAPALLLDLDGTLLDTAPDLAAALNHVLVEEGREPLPFGHIRPHVSHGAMRLVTLGFGEVGDAERLRLFERLIHLYAAAIATHSKLFDGFEALLQALHERGIPWGIVTNKIARLTDPLLQIVGLRQRMQCAVSGDTLPQRKPHPAPLLHAAALLNTAPEHCVYVGDAERDIQAARAAGMTSVVALWGYLGEQDRPQEWLADVMLQTPQDLHDWFFSRLLQPVTGPVTGASA
jgi:phosphoglycolate phosphatase